MVPITLDGFLSWKVLSSVIIGSALTFSLLFFLKWKNIIFIKVDEKSKSHGGTLVAKVLHNHGVKFLFTLVGGHISPILVAAENIGIRVIDTRHEATAVFAADAVARLTGGIGVAVVTAGPGITNCVTAAKNAQLAESPILLIGGAAASIMKGRGSLQDIDQMSLFRTICKFCGTAKTVREIVPLLRKAIQIALSGVPGPVFVEFPVDVLYEYAVVKREALGKSSPNKNWKAKLANWYVQKYIDNIFAKAWEPQDLRPLPVTTPMPNPKLVDQSTVFLLRAKRPFLVIGSQAMIPPISALDLRNAVTKLNIPTYLGGMARGLLGQVNHIQIRHSRRDALKNADLIILAGAVCDFRLSYGRALSKDAKIISVNRDPKLVQINAGLFWKPSLIIRGDVATFLVSLASSVDEYSCEARWFATLREKDNKREQEIFERAGEVPGDFMNPIKVLLGLEKLLPEKVLLIGDGGDFVGTASYILRPRAPLSWLDPGPFGTLGVGGGFALGAKLARPDAQVWILYGDGSCGYSIMEYDTFVRHQIPVASIVGNDASWSQIERDQRPLLGSSVACVLAHTNYHLVVQAMGAQGLSIVKRSASITTVVEAAKELNDDGISVMINALIAKSNFRAGSISL